MAEATADTVAAEHDAKESGLANERQEPTLDASAKAAVAEREAAKNKAADAVRNLPALQKILAEDGGGTVAANEVAAKEVSTSTEAQAEELDADTKRSAMEDLGYSEQALKGKTNDALNSELARFYKALASKTAQPKVEEKAAEVEKPTSKAAKLALKWKTAEERGGTEIDDEIKAQIEAINEHYAAQLEAALDGVKQVTSHVTQQQSDKLATEVDGIFTQLRNEIPALKEIIGENSVRNLDMKNEKDAKADEILVVAVGLNEAYQKSGKTPPPLKELIKRAAISLGVPTVTGTKTKAHATITARATSRTSPDTQSAKEKAVAAATATLEKHGVNPNE